SLTRRVRRMKMWKLMMMKTMKEMRQKRLERRMTDLITSGSVKLCSAMKHPQ
ncbi:hypothetical protein M9458_040814, partial [Cirrhinus mrigala]